MIPATSRKLTILIKFRTKFFLAFLLNLQLMTSQRSYLNYAPKPNLGLSVWASLIFCRSVCDVRPVKKAHYYEICAEGFLCIGLIIRANLFPSRIPSNLFFSFRIPHTPTHNKIQINKQSFSHLLLRPSKHYSLKTHIQEQTKQNCRPHLA